MKDFKSAFEQAINGFKQNPKKEATAIGGQFMQNLTNEFNQFKQQFQPKQPAPVDQNQQLLNTLVQNTMAQTAYTPQAKAYLNSIPVDYWTRPTNYSQVGAPLPNRAAAVYANGSPTGGNIIVESSWLKPGNSQAVEILRHEFNHALDQGVNNQNIPANFAPTGPNSANSNGFYNTLNNNDPQASHWINFFLQGYPKDQNIRNTEGFAEYGARGQDALLGPEASYYKNIFSPVSPAINYSPVFPAP